MQVFTNPNQVIFYRPTNPFYYNQQHTNTRSQSFYGQKGLNSISIKEGPTSSVNKVKKQVHLPRKVSFHQSNGKQTSSNSNVLIYPPSFPQINNISDQSLQNRKRFQSQYSKNSHDVNDKSQRMRIHSIDQKSQMSKNSGQNIVINSTSLKESDEMFINYPPHKSLNQLPNNVKNQHQFPRQRSQSVLSSKSSTKIILQTVRQVNPDGSRGAPIQIKHRIQTQYLTNLNNNRQNYHIISHQPKQIIISQQYVQSPQPFVRNFYSPQNVSTFSSTHQSQRVTESFSKNQNQQQTSQSINVNSKSSNFYSYPVNNAHQNQTHLNGFKSQSAQCMMLESKNKNLKSIQIPSKVQSSLKLDSRKIQSNQNINVIENHKLKGVHSTGFTQKFQQNETQTNFMNKATQLKDKNKSKYQVTKQFYSISQKMIDQIFRNQTEKALLKLNTIEHKYSPRKFQSPNLRRYNKN